MTGRSITRRLLAQLNPLVLLVPVVFTLAAAYFVATGSFAFDKEELEILPYFVLVPSTALGFVRFCAERRPFFLWITVLLGVLLCREIHFAGSSVGAPLAVVGLFVTLRYRWDALRDGFERPIFVNLLAAGFASYLISELMLDHNWARVPAHFAREHNFRSVLEETVELLGHFLVAMTVVLGPAADERGSR